MFNKYLSEKVMKSRFILSNGRDSEEKAQRSSCYKTRLAILTPPFTGRATPSQSLFPLWGSCRRWSGQRRIVGSLLPGAQTTRLRPGSSTDLELLGDLGLLSVHGVQDGGDDRAGAQEDELAQRGPPSALHSPAEPWVQVATPRSGPATTTLTDQHPRTNAPMQLSPETRSPSPSDDALRRNRKWGEGGTARADRKVLLPG